MKNILHFWYRQQVSRLYQLTLHQFTITRQKKPAISWDQFLEQTIQIGELCSVTTLVSQVVDTVPTKNLSKKYYPSWELVMWIFIWQAMTTICNIGGMNNLAWVIMADFRGHYQNSLLVLNLQITLWVEMVADQCQTIINERRMWTRAREKEVDRWCSIPHPMDSLT